MVSDRPTPRSGEGSQHQVILTSGFRQYAPYGCAFAFA